MIGRVCFFILLSYLCTNSKLISQVKEQKSIYDHHIVHFNYPNGEYSNEMLQNDFGNGGYPQGRAFANIVDSTYQITFKKGQLVGNTGAAVQMAIKPSNQYTIQYRIKYAPDFQKGLHGKQFGLEIGVGYDGGRGAQARANGNGGSVRLQFDAHESTISNQLYVYYSKMVGKFGNNPGNQHFSFNKNEWNTIKMTVTMQSSAKAADGRVEVWCNGEKKIDVGNLPFVYVDSARKITRLSFESFPGGGGTIPSYDNFLYVDDFQWAEGDKL